ncbi:MAG: tetratricopeptide repeat protein [Leptolyngbya sp. SIOISBB]|nr:tetratricopeptide repeat protein [Leptolyngbya sp. SIOISBB]
MLRPDASIQFTVWSSTTAPLCPLPGFGQASTMTAALPQSLTFPDCSQLYIRGWQYQEYGHGEAALRAFHELLIMGRQVGHHGWVIAAEQAIAGLSADHPLPETADAWQNPLVSPDLQTAEKCNRAAVLHTQGAWPEAIQAYQKVLSYATQAGHHVAMARCLNGLGLIYFDQQRFALAETRFRAAVAVLADIAAPMQSAIVSHNLGLAHYEQGHYDQAQTEFQKALECWQTGADCLGLALTLDYLGRVYAQKGESWLALGSFEAATDVLNDLVGDQDIRQAAAALLSQMAQFCEQKQHLYLAITYWQEVLAIYQDCSTAAPCIVIWQRLSDLYAQAGYPAIARQYAKRVCQSLEC